MASLNERIKMLRKSKSLSQQELGVKLGLGKSAISMYESGQREPDIQTVAKIANIFNVSTDYLLDTYCENQMANIDEASGMVKIPILGDVAAGYPRLAEENIVGHDYISPALASKGSYFALRAKGESMYPLIKDGDTMVIRQQEDIESGQIAVVIINNESTVKRVKKTEEGITLIAENPSVYSPKQYSNHEIETIPIRIAGRVIFTRTDF